MKFPEGVKIENVIPPTPSLPCPIRHNYLWSLLSHLTLSYTSLADVSTFKRIMRLYNWVVEENHINHKRIDAITDIHLPRRITRYKNGELIRGIEFVVEIDMQKLTYDEGEIQMFGLVLCRFLAQYVTINSFVMLTMIDNKKKRKFKWEPAIGTILPV